MSQRHFQVPVPGQASPYPPPTLALAIHHTRFPLKLSLRGRAASAAARALNQNRRPSAPNACRPLDVGETAAPNKINFNGIGALQSHVRCMRFSDLQLR
jgi:hypothetical protein